MSKQTEVKLTREQREVVSEALMVNRIEVLRELTEAKNAVQAAFRLLSSHRMWEVGGCDSLGEALTLDDRVIALAACIRRYRNAMQEKERVEEARKVVRSLPVAPADTIWQIAKDSTIDHLDSVGEELASAARWLAERGYRGDDGDPLPDFMSTAAVSAISNNPAAFKENVRIEAEALGK